MLIRGNLSGYLVRPETLDSLAPEMQAEIRFGLENSQDGTEEDMLENVESFLQKDEDEIWRNNAEPTLSLIHISEPTRRLRGSRMPSSA